MILKLFPLFFLGVVQVQQMDSTPTIYHPVRGVKKGYEESEDKINRVQRHKTSPELRYPFFKSLSSISDIFMYRNVQKAI